MTLKERNRRRKERARAGARKHRRHNRTTSRRSEWLALKAKNKLRKVKASPIKSKVQIDGFRDGKTLREVRLEEERHARVRRVNRMLKV